MKVDELRSTLSAYDLKTLQEVIVMLYKKIPKDKRESEGLDEIIKDFTSNKAKQSKKEAPPIDFSALETEIENFIEYANMQYYFAPNRYVNKSKRAKWRFEVKRFIKALLSVRGENGEEATRLLARIYEMLCYGCNYYIFSSDNPFSAIGYSQPELLRIVLGRILYKGVDPASIKDAAFLTLDSNVDRDTWHMQLLYVFLDVMKTVEAKEMALEQCIAFQKGYDSYQQEKEHFRYNLAYDNYRKEEKLKYAVELYLIIKLDLHEYDEGINYFWKNYKETRKEVSLYVLLTHFLSGEGCEDLWIREYEKAAGEGIQPRESLEEKYAERKAGKSKTPASQ